MARFRSEPPHRQGTPPHRGVVVRLPPARGAAESELPTKVVETGHGPLEFRLDRRRPETVVIFHGGHMRAGLALGEEPFTQAGYSLLVPSRPGYGRTPVKTGGSPEGFADAIAALCARLGVTRVAAVVGVSGGGPTAVAMAARHPALVERLILQSAVGPVPWPDRRTYLGAHVVFAPRTEPATWALVHALVRHAPDAALRMLLRDLTVLSVGKVVAGLRARAPGDGDRLVHADALGARVPQRPPRSQGRPRPQASVGRSRAARPGDRQPLRRRRAVRPCPGPGRRSPESGAAGEPRGQSLRLVRRRLARHRHSDPRLPRALKPLRVRDPSRPSPRPYEER